MSYISLDVGLLCKNTNSANQPNSNKINQSVSQSVNQPINRSVDQSFNRSIDQSVNFRLLSLAGWHQRILLTNKLPICEYWISHISELSVHYRIPTPIGKIRLTWWRYSLLNDTVSYQRWLVSPFSLMKAWDWHCQSAKRSKLSGCLSYDVIMENSFRHAHSECHSFIHSFIHSDHFYSASSSPLLLRSAPDIARILCQSFTPKRHSQLQVKDLPKDHTWRLERESNPRPSGWKVSTQGWIRPTHCAICAMANVRSKELTNA